MHRTVAWLLLTVPVAAAAEETTFSARRLMETSVTRDVALDPAGTSIVLERGELIADDGPSAGFSYKPNEETLTPGVRIRKELPLSDPRVERAFLLLGSSGDVEARVNGQPVPLDKGAKAGNYWKRYEFPAGLLKSGLNSVELSGKGKVWIARDDEFAAGAEEGESPPNRSAKSLDGGTTWSDDRLGTRGDVDGEYAVRLYLDRSRAAGLVRLPVVDLGNLSESRIAPALEGLPSSVHLGWNGDHEGGRFVLRVRSGVAPSPSSPEWSDWQEVTEKDGLVGSVVAVKGRFLQVEITLTPGDPRRTPKLREISISAEAQAASSWQTKWRAKQWNAAEIVRTSIPFRYEPFDHPRLKRLREELRLDEVVEGSRSEWERIERLAAWASQRWDAGHLGKIYPAWDALDILALHDDGKPVGGFCQQYNLVFLQACESYGLVGRCVSIGSGDHGVEIRSGHEVVEIWSNEFAKWVYVDGNAAWYFRDAATDVPLSLRELRERQLAALGKRPFAGVKLVTLAKTRYEWTDLTGWPAFAELRLVPRSNFLERKSPLPLNQGMRGWFWTGHYVWTDAAYPASMLYGNRVGNPSNWDWSLNQAQVRLEATTTAGEVRVHLETETPGFEKYFAAIDEDGSKAVESGFLWRLHAGENRLEVWPQNRAGRRGVTSRIVLSDESPRD